MRSHFVKPWESAILKWGYGEMEEHYFFLQVRTIISICELHYYFLLGITLIKLRTIIGLPYLSARSSKWNFVAWYVGSYLCTGSQNRGRQKIERKVLQQRRI